MGRLSNICGGRSDNRDGYCFLLIHLRFDNGSCEERLTRVERIRLLLAHLILNMILIATEIVKQTTKKEVGLQSYWSWFRHCQMKKAVLFAEMASSTKTCLWHIERHDVHSTRESISKINVHFFRWMIQTSSICTAWREPGRSRPQPLSSNHGIRLYRDVCQQQTLEANTNLCLRFWSSRGLMLSRLLKSVVNTTTWCLTWSLVAAGWQSVHRAKDPFKRQVEQRNNFEDFLGSNRLSNDARKNGSTEEEEWLSRKKKNQASWITSWKSCFVSRILGQSWRRLRSSILEVLCSTARCQGFSPSRSCGYLVHHTDLG